MHHRVVALAALIALPLVTQAQAQSLGMPRGGLLIHGNYCGPGNRAPLPPIDALDAACARHDACSPGRGRPATAACNDRLRRDAEAVANDPRQPSDLRGTAGVIAFGAALLPSAPDAAPSGGPYVAHAYRPGPLPWPAPVDAGPDDDEEE